MDRTPIAGDAASSERQGAGQAATARRGAAAGRLDRFCRSPLGLGLSGAILLWAALPPLDLWLLGWLAPIPWLVLIERRELTGRRPYMQIWLAGFAFWLAAIYWLCLPHWATSVGWLALSFYLALYWPAFIGLSRVAVHQLRLPTLIAAPLVFWGLELARAHLLTGFTMTGLAHSQYRWTALIQVVDLAGTPGLGALMILVAAAVARMLPGERGKISLWPLLPAGAALGLCLAYGLWRIGQDPTRLGPKAALIQGAIDITMKMDPSQTEPNMMEYVNLTREAVRRASDLDLIVWPETMFRYSWFMFDEGAQPPANFGATADEVQRFSLEAVRQWTGGFAAPILLGIDTAYFHSDDSNAPDRFNSALYFDGQRVAGRRYDKVHRVMFGEYVPFADWFPWLYRLTPLPGGLTRGAGPVAIDAETHAAGPVRYAPNICFESTLSHFIRGQVETLRREGAEPDVLVNLTNDGWFWGSSELEMHLSCAVFRAVECRKPFLIAANTGISASIDSQGRIQAEGPKRATDVIIAQPRLDDRRSPYLIVGDWPAGVCLVFCLALAWIGWRGRK